MNIKTSTLQDTLKEFVIISELTVETIKDMSSYEFLSLSETKELKLVLQPLGDKLSQLYKEIRLYRGQNFNSNQE